MKMKKSKKSNAGRKTFKDESKKRKGFTISIRQSTVINVGGDEVARRELVEFIEKKEAKILKDREKSNS